MTAKPFTIAAEWQEFERRVLDEVNSPVQREEMRKAFYCGAMAAFFGLVDAMDPRSADATPGDMRVIDNLVAEFERFKFEMFARARAAQRGNEWH